MPLVPELFDLGAFHRVSATAPPGIDTPLGRFALSPHLEPPTSPDALAHLRAANIELFIWESAAARVELRVSHPIIELPDGMRVTDALAAIWRIRARRPLFVVELACELGAGTHRTPTPETGQGLEGVVWEANGVRLSLGTPDAEALLHFLGDGAPFPKSWLAAWGDTGTIPIVEHGRRGLRVRLPALAENELAQTHFVAAWAPDDEPSDATWFAVDQSPRTLLRHREPAV